MSELVNLRTTQQLLEVPEPEWLIEDHIHQQEVGVLYGAPNGGKTFVALDWALSVAAGVKWLKRYRTLQAPILYMAGEGAPSLQKRVEAWLDYHKRSDVPACFQCRPLPILEEDVVEEIQAALAAFHVEEGLEPGVSPGLIVVDTLSQFMMGGDENGTDMALFVARLRHLSQEENCAVLIVHHTNKGGISERGHTALRGNVDVMFKVTAKEEHGTIVGIELMNDKQRDNPRAKPETMAVSSSQRSLVLSLAKSTLVPVNVLGLTSESLVKLLLAAGTIELTSSEVFTVDDWLTASDDSRSKFYRLVHNLLDLKLVKTAGRGKYRFTPRGRETMFYYQSHRPKIGVFEGFPSSQIGGFL